MAILERSEHYGDLQRVIDFLYEKKERVCRLDVIMAVETFDLTQDLREIVELLPPGTYTRIQLCHQLNSSISGHGWGYTYGTVE